MEQDRVRKSIFEFSGDYKMLQTQYIEFKDQMSQLKELLGKESPESKDCLEKFRASQKLRDEVWLNLKSKLELNFSSIQDFLKENWDIEIEISYYWLESSHQSELRKIVRQAFSKQVGFLVSKVSAKLVITYEEPEDEEDEEPEEDLDSQGKYEAQQQQKVSDQMLSTQTVTKNAPSKDEEKPIRKNPEVVKRIWLKEFDPKQSELKVLVDKPLDFGVKITSYLVILNYIDSEGYELGSVEQDTVPSESQNSKDLNCPTVNKIDTISVKINPPLGTNSFDLQVFAVNRDGRSDIPLV